MTGIEIAGIAAALGAMKNLRDLMNGLGDTVPQAVRDEVLALSGSLSAAHAQASELIQQQHQLRDQVKRLQDWETEKTRYALQKRGKKYLHELRRESANGEPQHWLCPKCFSEGRKSILQGLDAGMWGCLACGSGLLVGLDTHP